MSSHSSFIAVTNKYVSGKGGNFDLLNRNQKVGWKFSFKIISKVVDPFITDPRVKQSGLVSSVSSVGPKKQDFWPKINQTIVLCEYNE